MKIIIGLVLLALLYFIYKKVTGDKASNTATPSNTVEDKPTAPATSASQVTPESHTEQNNTSSAVSESSNASASSAASAAAPEQKPNNAESASNSLPLEHLAGIDRRAGKALRALGITDVGELLNAGADKLNAAGFDAAAAKVLQAQAALSALPGVTPHEASVLASSGVDSIAALAKLDPAELLSDVARANKGSGALKSAPGVQQLQRIINSAKAAA